MIAIINYGVGNLYSLRCSLGYIGERAVVTSSAEEIKSASGLILPGVGAFGDAYDKLCETGLIPLIRERAASGVPLLGICLGMQLLFDKSFEYGEHEGLGLINGEVRPIAEELTECVKIPHMGWNSLDICGDNPIFRHIGNGAYVYYVHSYHAVCDESYKSATSYYGGARLTGAVMRDNIFGTQFHPEKSGETGLSILKDFCALTKRS